MTAHGVVLLNAQAGGGAAAALREPIEAWLARELPGVVVLVPGEIDEAHAMLSILANRSRVALVGGDGTLQRLLPAILARGHRIGLVPAGHTNRLATAIGLTVAGWQPALRAALLAPTRPIDLMQFDAEGQIRYAASCVLSQHSGPGRAASARLWVNGQLVRDGRAQRIEVVRAGPLPDVKPGQAAALQTRWMGEPPWWHRQMRRLGFSQGQGPHEAAPRIWPTHKLLIDAEAPLPLSLDGEVIEASERFSVQRVPHALQIARFDAHLDNPPR